MREEMLSNQQKVELVAKGNFALISEAMHLLEDVGD